MGLVAREGLYFTFLNNSPILEVSIVSFHARIQLLSEVVLTNLTSLLRAEIFECAKITRWSHKKIL